MSGFLSKLFWWLPIGSVPEISAVDLQQKLKDKESPQLLDVRSPPEWQSGIIEGSVLVSVQNLKGQIDTLNFDKSKPVIAICRSAHRSIGAVRLLEAAGYEEAVQLEGGIMTWEGNGFAVVKP